MHESRPLELHQREQSPITGTTLIRPGGGTTALTTKPATGEPGEGRTLPGGPRRAVCGSAGSVEATRHSGRGAFRRACVTSTSNAKLIDQKLPHVHQTSHSPAEYRPICSN